MPSIQLQTFEQMVWDRVEQNLLFYPKAEVDVAINESIQVANLFGRFAQGRVPLGNLSIANRVIYDMPAGLIFPTDVYFEEAPLEEASVKTVSARMPTWMAGIVGTKPSYWVPIGLAKFALVPVDRYGGNLIEVAGVMEPTPLVNPTDTSLLPDEWVDVVVDYSYITLVLDEGGAIFNTALGLYKQVQGRISELSSIEELSWPDLKLSIQSPK